MERPVGLLRKEGVTLLMMLGMVYLFVTATLPAILERQELARRREATEAEVQELLPRVQRLQDWKAAAEKDPLTRERLLESWRLSPDAPGYRVLPDPDASQPGDGRAK